MRSIFFICFCSVLFLAACDTNTKKKAETHIFTSDSMHFTIELPKDWKAYARPGKIGLLEPLQDSSDHFQENIVIWTEDLPLPIPDTLYTKATVTELRIKNPDLQIQTYPALSLGENTLGQFAFQVMLNDSVPCRVLGFTALHNNRGYNITCNYLANTKTDYSALFRSILKSLHLQ